MEDIESPAGGVEGSVLRRLLGELIDAFGYSNDGEDSEDGGRECEDWG